MVDTSSAIAWQNLASAIIQRAVKDLKRNKNDVNAKVFLESDWCDTLRYFVSLRIKGSDIDYQSDIKY